jgi:hypothetical protein
VDAIVNECVKMNRARPSVDFPNIAELREFKVVIGCSAHLDLGSLRGAGRGAGDGCGR